LQKYIFYVTNQQHKNVSKVYLKDLHQFGSVLALTGITLMI